MPVLLPLIPSEPFYSFTTTLAEVEYLIGVRWNTREASWYYDISTVEGEVLRAGNKFLLGSFAPNRAASADMPQGLFVVEDTSGENTDATFEDLGVRVICYFYTYEEWLEELG